MPDETSLFSPEHFRRDLEKALRLEGELIARWSDPFLRDGREAALEQAEDRFDFLEARFAKLRETGC